MAKYSQGPGAMIRAQIGRLLLVVGTLVLSVQRPAWAQSQPAIDRLYALYNSTSTPATYKELLQEILWTLDPRSRLTMAGNALSPASSSIRSASSVPAAAGPQALTADPTLRMVDSYVFPNPSKRSDKPTIRVQVGLADSVSINIYDISGQLVHSVSVNNPQVLDDGNGKGPQYTYDYVWDTSGVGSGVYVVAITAKKAGAADIRSRRKIGIVK